MLAHEVFDPKNIPLCLNTVIYRFITLWILLFSPPLILGVIIPIGRGGLCKTLMRH